MSIASVTSCVTASGTQGTITATIEEYAHTEEFDIWRRQGTNAILELRFIGSGQVGPVLAFSSQDLLQDGDPKIVAVESNASAPDVLAVDIVEETGRVVVHVPTDPPSAAAPSTNPPGIQIWTSPRKTSVTKETIDYTNGSWRFADVTSVSVDAIPTPSDGFR